MEIIGSDGLRRWRLGGCKNNNPWRSVSVERMRVSVKEEG